MAAEKKDTKWDIIIKANKVVLSLNLGELLKYKDLISLFVKRDITTIYKQTILGPVWFLLQSLLTSIAFTFIFGFILNIPSNGIPHTVFYMSGIILWNFFSSSVIKTSNTFVSNATLFEKVYFPRLCVPISVIISNSFTFFIQYIVFILMVIYYTLFTSSHLIINFSLLPLTLFLIVLTGFMGLGLGLIISSLTAKFRDLTFLVSFLIQLMMYASPVIFPLSSVSNKIKTIILLNPMSSIIETFRYVFLGSGIFNILYLIYPLCFTILTLSLGTLIFNFKEKSFIDSV